MLPGAERPVPGLNGIEVIRITRGAGNTYQVDGAIVEVTSSGEAARRAVALTVEKRDGTWRISAVHWPPERNRIKCTKTGWGNPSLFFGPVFYSLRSVTTTSSGRLKRRKGKMLLPQPPAYHHGGIASSYMPLVYFGEQALVRGHQTSDQGQPELASCGHGRQRPGRCPGRNICLFFSGRWESNTVNIPAWPAIRPARLRAKISSASRA